MEQYKITKIKNKKIYNYGINPYPFVDYDFITDKFSDLDIEYVSFGYRFCRITTDLDIEDKLKELFGDNIQNFYETSFKYSYVINFENYENKYKNINGFDILVNDVIDYDNITNFLIKENLDIVKFGYRYLIIYSNDDIRNNMYKFFGQCIKTTYVDSTYKYTITIDLELYNENKLKNENT